MPAWNPHGFALLIFLTASPLVILSGAETSVRPACFTVNESFCNRGTSATGSPSLLQVRARRSSVFVGTSVQAEVSLHVRSRTASVLASASALRERSVRHAVFVGGLHRALTALDKSQNQSNAELDNLITSFINHHAADEDKCPARLMEAKHQLNDLHKAIIDLAELINTTETDVHVINGDLGGVLDKLKDLDKKGDVGRKKADGDRADNQRMLTVLRQEMEEMRQIAQPNVTMTIPSGSVSTDGGPLALLQLAAAGVQNGENVVGVQHLVLQTKDVASAMVTCFLQLRQQRDEAQQQLLLVQASSAAMEAVSAPVGRVALLSANTTGSPNCTVNSTVGVEVGGTSTTIMFGPGVINGTSGFYHCSKVNAAYGGVLMLHCINGVLTADPRGCFKFADESRCLAQKQQLEDTYVKAYVELARLIKEYEELASPDGDGDVGKDVENAQKGPLQDKADKLAADQEEKVKQLEDLRPRLEDMLRAEKKLQEHIKKLSEECRQLPDTESGLQKVREAIRALEACPGLGRAEFHIPAWAGEWVQILQDNTKTHVANDAAALQACEAKYGRDKSIRVAEVSEIMATSVEGMPRSNTAPVPLLGACPQCEGADDDATGLSNADGHSRICWDADAKLNQASRRIDCSRGQKAVMCVYDRGDIRKSKWVYTTPQSTVPAATSTTTSTARATSTTQPPPAALVNLSPSHPQL